MGKYVSLDLVKKHVRADDFTADDEYLEILCNSAEEHIITMTQAEESDLVAAGDGDLPLQLKQAVLLLVGHWYNQREGVSSNLSAIPYGIDALVKPFRVLVHSSEESK